MSARSRSPNGRAASTADGRIGVQLAITDADLAARVRRELAGQSVLVEAGMEAPLVLSDRRGTSRTPAPDAASPWPERQPSLSHREQEVAGLLLEGASNKSIARRLDISVHTAKFHVTQILDKLGAQNRADAVSIILRDGLVTL